MAKFKRKFSSHSFTPTVDPEYHRHMAELKREFNRAKAEVKRLYQEIAEFAEEGANKYWHEQFDKLDWDTGLTKIEAVKFKKAWYSAFKESGGRIRPSIKTYKSKLRTGKVKEYLKYTTNISRGYAPVNYVKALMNAIQNYFGMGYEFAYMPFINYLQANIEHMEEDRVNAALDLIYGEGNEPMDVYLGLEEILGVKGGLEQNTPTALPEVGE